MLNRLQLQSSGRPKVSPDQRRCRQKICMVKCANFSHTSSCEVSKMVCFIKVEELYLQFNDKENCQSFWHSIPTG